MQVKSWVIASAAETVERDGTLSNDNVDMSYSTGLRRLLKRRKAPTASSDNFCACTNTLRVSKRTPARTPVKLTLDGVHLPTPAGRSPRRLRRRRGVRSTPRGFAPESRASPDFDSSGLQWRSLDRLRSPPLTSYSLLTLCFFYSYSHALKYSSATYTKFFLKSLIFR